MNYYQILGVKHDSSLEDIQTAYRSLARQFHPDASGTKDTHEKMCKINQAYEVLKDEDKRRDYDRDLRGTAMNKPGAQEEYTRKWNVKPDVDIDELRRKVNENLEDILKTMKEAKQILEEYTKEHTKQVKHLDKKTIAQIKKFEKELKVINKKIAKNKDNPYALMTLNPRKSFLESGINLLKKNNEHVKADADRLKNSTKFDF
ncbi:MAG: DnaJ domain-containing protein [Firmicutes bacterium]|nr:DnaJ domain-containing protein [Bacillota bacterium]